MHAHHILIMPAPTLALANPAPISSSSTLLSPSLILDGTSPLHAPAPPPPLHDPPIHVPSIFPPAALISCPTKLNSSAPNIHPVAAPPPPSSQSRRHSPVTLPTSSLIPNDAGAHLFLLGTSTAADPVPAAIRSPSQTLLPRPPPSPAPMTLSCDNSAPTNQYIRSRRTSFYALSEGAGSSCDMKAGTVEIDDQHFAFVTQNQRQSRVINEVEISDGNYKVANLEHQEADAGEDRLGPDDEPELMYGLRQNPKRTRRLVADHDAGSEEGDNMVNKGSGTDLDIEAQTGTAEIRPASVSYKKNIFPKLQDSAPAACTECGKAFGSWKALFGHMRCHPEREWRGIQPPAEYNTRAPSKVLYTGKPNSNLESKRYILVKPLRKKSTEFIKSSKSPPNYDMDASAIKVTNDGDDSLLGCLKENLELQWSACGRQVMLEEEEESENESIEAAYISNKADQGCKSLGLLASLPRGKRSKRSHFTIKSLRSVQDQLAAEVSHDEEKLQPAKKEDLEMATCLVMLALAGSDNEVEKQEEGYTAPLKEDAEGNVDDITDDDESSACDQLHLSWGRSTCGTTEPIRAIDGSNIDINTGGRDGALTLSEGGKYECTACKRIFKSHQALGGHRASHKKVKGCFAKTAGEAEVPFPPYLGKEETSSGIPNFLSTSMLSLAGNCKYQSVPTNHTHLGSSVPEYMAGDCKDLSVTLGSASTGHDNGSAASEVPRTASWPNVAESGQLQLLLNGMDVAAASRSSKLALHNNSTSKYHQCSICQRVFSSGQALGGHKRCHWAAEKTAGILGAERAIMTRPELVAGGGRTAFSAMACAVAPGPTKLSFFARSMTSEEAVTHQVKVLDIDLNLPAPLDHVIDDPSKLNSAALGSLLSLGQCSSVTIRHDPDIGFSDDDALHRGASADGGSVLSVSSSPSSTTSIPIPE